MLVRKKVGKNLKKEGFVKYREVKGYDDNN